MKKESLIGKKYLPSDNSYIKNLTSNYDSNSVELLAGDGNGRKRKECKIVSEPFMCKNTVGKDETKEHKMILVEYNNSTYSVLFFEENVIDDEPLFITYDGVPIYDRETLVYGCPKDWNFQFEMNFEMPVEYISTDNWNWFYTPEAANKWMEKQINSIKLGKNNLEFNVGNDVYWVDEYFIATKRTIFKDDFNDLKKLLENKVVYYNYKEALNDAKYFFNNKYHNLIDYFDDIFNKFQYALGVNNIPYFTQYKKLKKYYLLNYLASHFNISSFIINKKYIIMDNYDVVKVSEKSITDITFYDKKDAELAAKIMKKYFED